MEPNTTNLALHKQNHYATDQHEERAGKIIPSRTARLLGTSDPALSGPGGGGWAKRRRRNKKVDSTTTTPRKTRQDERK
jgi:hypothetical protein